MKKNIQIAILLLGALMFGTSCSEDTMDRLNLNVNNPYEAPTRFTLTDVMVRTAHSVVGSDLAFYSAVYIEHSVGIFGQMNGAEMRAGEPTAATTYNNSWNNIYLALRHLRTVIERSSPYGEEEGNYQSLGIAQILTAYNLAILTDLFGDVPWSEALQPGVIFAPRLDSQESIYREIFRLLEEGIANLRRPERLLFPGGLIGRQDLIYLGDDASWIRFAYGLKARYTMRLSHRTPNFANVIAFANNSFQNRYQEAKMEWNGTTAVSPFGRFFIDRNQLGASQSLHNRLTDRNDPRNEIFFVPPRAGGNILFGVNGSPTAAQNRYALSGLSIAGFTAAGAPIANLTAPTFLMSYHELQFLVAEAHARLGNLTEARAALLRAITAAFAKVNVRLSAQAAQDYFDSLANRLTTQEDLLAEIMVQKYLAFFEEEAIEAFNDIRRLKAKGENFIELSHPGDFPLRFTYGSSDVITNVNVREAYGDGTYVFTEPVWWAGGRR